MNQDNTIQKNAPQRKNLVHQSTEKLKTASFPEEAFLENDPIISPADMSHCLLSRTGAIVDCLSGLMNDSEFSPPRDMITEVLSQVSSNLEQLERFLDKWHQGSRTNLLPGQVSLSLHCETRDIAA